MKKIKIVSSEEKFKSLTDIIQSELNVNILEDKSRLRVNVEARMIFCCILKDYGYGCSELSRVIGMDHTSVLHYFKSLPNLLLVDRELRFRYNYIKSEFACYDTDTEKHPSHDPYQLNQVVVELKKELYALNKDNKLLHCKVLDKDIELDNAKSYTKKLKIRDGRLENIFKLVEERTRIGTEDNILIKLNRFYNGAY
tara:strand:- start:23740 stop:24330 length:591 start_codon:yes stop_codon:yes gene_type:complete